MEGACYIIKSQAILVGWMKKILLIFLLKKKTTLCWYKQSVVNFYPEVETVVEILSKKLSLAIVTAGHEDQFARDRADKISQCVHSNSLWGQVKKNKPSPDPYVTACREHFQTLPESIVVENAPFGVESAVSAGCYLYRCYFNV